MPRRKQDSKIKILYHQKSPDVYKDGKKVRSGTDCPDGIAAAWVALRKYPEAQLIGCVYQSEELPQVNDGDKLIIVDFSFEVDVINSWRDRGCEVILIDHHKTLVDKVYDHATRELKKQLAKYFQANKYKVPSPILDNYEGYFKPFLSFLAFTDFWQKVKSTNTYHKSKPRFYEILTTTFTDLENRNYISWLNFVDANSYPVEPTEDHPYFSYPDGLLLDDLKFVILVEQYILKFCEVTNIKTLFKYFSDSDLSFEIEKCGATLAWTYFFPNEPIPAFLTYIQDRDLWTWERPKSKEINEAFSHIRHGCTRNQVLAEFDRFYGMTQDDLIYHFETLGEMLLAPKLRNSRELVKKAHWVTALGYKFLACPLEPSEAFYYGDVMEILYNENPDSPFVCTYIRKEDGYKLSFRSKQQYNGFDVSRIARSIGGGGHRAAAGSIVKELPWE